MKFYIFGVCILVWVSYSFGQILNRVDIGENNNFYACTINQHRIELSKAIPLFCCTLNSMKISSTELLLSQDKVKFHIKKIKQLSSGLQYKIIFENISSDTIEISNLIPFGESGDKTYITSSGPWALARAKLFRPNQGPVNVTLPDNVWHLGYASFPVNDTYSIGALIRRSDYMEAKRYRYKMCIYPSGRMSYDFYLEAFQGNWQEGLKLVFQKKYLYDLETFDNTLYQRKDLQWIQKVYFIDLMFAWDHDYYDYKSRKYTVFDFSYEGKKYFGKYDILGIWPTWPRLGVDERNQWDMYRDLPGGLEETKNISHTLQQSGTKFFIAYNPWDKSTRQEDQFEGMAFLIRSLDANGVVLDCRGSSSKKLQATADRVKPGVIMYSEGMPVTKDMPGILAGRVHDAIFLQPPLNLNKLIKPDISIFRVCQLSEGRIHRETAISFFNGYGTEINTFAPGRPEWMESEYEYLGKTIKILRENSSIFSSYNFTPLINALVDSIWVNKWSKGNKTIYTVLSFNPEGHAGPLFEVQESDNTHFVSIWNHEELKPVQTDLTTYISVRIKSFNRNWLNTRREGNVDCIVKLQKRLRVDYFGDSLKINTSVGDSICIWRQECSYTQRPFVSTHKEVNIKLREVFGRYEGKLIIQLFKNGELEDERIIYRKPGKPVLVGQLCKTSPPKGKPENMIKIPSGEFRFYAFNTARFIPYPDNADSCLIYIHEFYMDRFPVTNKQFLTFIKQSDYLPQDTSNYLKHWEKGKYKEGDAYKPVVYVSLRDAQAYAQWAGKRLPTETEWQYAAQGSDGRKWPWGNTDDSTKYNISGKLESVGQHPEAASPFGVEDLVGNVWQLTRDVYDNASYYFVIMRGGSYYNPTSSQWYVQGGPQKLYNRQMLLLISSGFNRNSTVGFRCVKDID